MAGDEAIVAGIRLLAETEGIFTEPAGGTTMAVAKQLIDAGRIPRDETLVIAITGNGYKTQEAVADIAKPNAVIDPKVSAVTAALQEIDGWSDVA
jgi:threonine synthase